MCVCVCWLTVLSVFVQFHGNFCFSDVIIGSGEVEYNYIVVLYAITGASCQCNVDSSIRLL